MEIKRRRQTQNDKGQGKQGVPAGLLATFNAEMEMTMLRDPEQNPDNPQLIATGVPFPTPYAMGAAWHRYGRRIECQGAGSDAITAPSSVIETIINFER